MCNLPPEFRGVWERVEVTVDGEVISDAGRSFWLQAASRFVDVRAAGGSLPSEAFAGTTSWHPNSATLSWSHEVDMHPEGRDDSGRIEWIDGDLVEHGTADQFGDVIHYTEVWRRRSRPGDEVVVAERVDGIGALAWSDQLGVVTIDDRPGGPLRGGVFERRTWGWPFLVTHGQPLGSSPLPLTAHRFAGWGATWHVVDRSVDHGT